MIRIIDTPDNTAIAIKLSDSVDTKEMSDINAFLKAELDSQPEATFNLYIDIDENLKISSAACLADLIFSIKYHSRFHRKAIISGSQSIARLMKLWELFNKNSSWRFFDAGDEGAAMVWISH